ncbi:hypothetical protein [Nostoc sp. UHCC 0251]|uniref:hypothetical protein n=1 Tax=Nostoc sp. UHCC 0251 TaxID=3110240 RepID=UPI002B1FD638|nr:hypothetical protein [Nostoc sp. UHCC 0251]MEA5622712.1 hypothetical protein [Nostoc sp. UHCC 0251]
MLLKSFQQEFILVWNNGQSWKDTGLTIIELCDLSIEFVDIHNQFNLPRMVKGLFWIVEMTAQCPLLGLYTVF